MPEILAFTSTSHRLSKFRRSFKFSVSAASNEIRRINARVINLFIYDGRLPVAMVAVKVVAKEIYVYFSVVIYSNS